MKLIAVSLIALLWWVNCADYIISFPKDKDYQHLGYVILHSLFDISLLLFIFEKV